MPSVGQSQMAHLKSHMRGHVKQLHCIPATDRHRHPGPIQRDILRNIDRPAQRDDAAASKLNCPARFYGLAQLAFVANIDHMGSSRVRWTKGSAKADKRENPEDRNDKPPAPETRCGFHTKATKATIGRWLHSARAFYL